MRILLTFTALVMATVIALQFAGEGNPIRPFENMSVVVLYAGNESGGWDHEIQQGFRAAAHDLGCYVQFQSTSWNPESAAAAFQEAMSTGPMAICVMGYPAQDLLLPHLLDARDLEIVVTSYNSPFPQGEQSFSREGFGYAGTDGHAAGLALIQAAIKKHDLAPGATALLVGDLDHPATGAFRDGCLAAFEDGGVVVETLKTATGELMESTADFRAMLVERRRAGTLPDVICFTERRLNHIARALEEARFAPGEVPLVGISIAPKPYDAPNQREWDRYVSLYVAEDLKLQTYLAVLQACIGRTYGSQGLHVNTPFQIFDRDNPPRPLSHDSENLFVQRY